MDCCYTHNIYFLVCPQPPNTAAIVAGTVGGVIGVGIIILLIWKLLLILKVIIDNFNTFTDILLLI